MPPSFLLGFLTSGTIQAHVALMTVKKLYDKEVFPRSILKGVVEVERVKKYVEIGGLETFIPVCLGRFRHSFPGCHTHHRQRMPVPVSSTPILLPLEGNKRKI